jgi:hypothetical protein
MFDALKRSGEYEATANQDVTSVILAKLRAAQTYESLLDV